MRGCQKVGILTGQLIMSNIKGIVLTLQLQWRAGSPLLDMTLEITFPIFFFCLNVSCCR